jgi:hypothetical protein
VKRLRRSLHTVVAARRRRVIIAGLGAAVVAAGIAATTAAIGGAAAAKTSKTTWPATHLSEVSGGTASQQALLREIVAGMQPTVVEKIEITDSGDDAALHFSAPSGRLSPALWQEGVIAGAFRDRLSALGDKSNVLIFGGDANGVPLNNHGPATPLPPAQPGDAAAAKQLFENAAAKTGVSFDHLVIHQPDGIAVVATFRSDDPASFLVHQMPTFLGALGDHSNLDGTYISLEDGSGQPVWETSSNDRISEGSVGSRPDLAGCSPVSNWSGFKTPPCPAK